MMKSRFTPGPWRINKYGTVGAGEFGQAPVVAAIEPFYGTDQRFGDHSANARLIAAAPDLLNAALLLEAAEDANANCPECEGESMPENCPKCLPLFDDARIARRAAIAKASGQTEPLPAERAHDGKASTNGGPRARGEGNL